MKGTGVRGVEGNWNDREQKASNRNQGSTPEESLSLSREKKWRLGQREKKTLVEKRKQTQAHSRDAVPMVPGELTPSNAKSCGPTGGERTKEGGR